MESLRQAGQKIDSIIRGLCLKAVTQKVLQMSLSHIRNSDKARQINRDGRIIRLNWLE
jgi:hypothetical protein